MNIVYYAVDEMDGQLYIQKNPKDVHGILIAPFGLMRLNYWEKYRRNYRI